MLVRVERVLSCCIEIHQQHICRLIPAIFAGISLLAMRQRESERLTQQDRGYRRSLWRLPGSSIPPRNRCTLPAPPDRCRCRRCTVEGLPCRWGRMSRSGTSLHLAPAPPVQRQRNDKNNNKGGGYLATKNTDLAPVSFLFLKDLQWNDTDETQQCVQ